MRPLWSQTLPAPPRGLALAREPGWVLLWDVEHRLCLLNQAGVMQAQRIARAPCSAVCVADDGSCAAAGGEAGQLWLLAPDLSLLWQRAMPYRVTALALSPLGEHLAAADAGGGLHVLDRHGQTVWTAATPRALHYLTFVPERPCLVGAADFGLVTCFDAAGRALWQEGLVTHAGSLSASADGSMLTLACFTQGLVHFTLEGARQRSCVYRSPCHQAALSYDGKVVLTAGLDHRLTLAAWDTAGHSRYDLESPPMGIALGPLGDFVVAATEASLLALVVQPR